MYAPMTCSCQASNYCSWCDHVVPPLGADTLWWKLYLKQWYSATCGFTTCPVWCVESDIHKARRHSDIHKARCHSDILRWFPWAGRPGRWWKIVPSLNYTWSLELDPGQMLPGFTGRNFKTYNLPTIKAWPNEWVSAISNISITETEAKLSVSPVFNW